MEVDNSKRMVFADVKVSKDGKPLGTASPAKFIFKRMPESPTTEVAMLHSLRDDLYLVVGTINPQTKVASLQVHINPLVFSIWLGGVFLVFGSIVCMWPELQPEESRSWAFLRGGAAAAASISIGVLIAVMPSPARAQSSSLHAGTVEMKNPQEKAVFESLRCMCGGCERLPLSGCACPEADTMRAEIRSKIAAGVSKEEIIAQYLDVYGTAAATMPPDAGGFRAVYAVPLTAIAAAGVISFLATRWRRQASSLTRTTRRLRPPAPSSRRTSTMRASTTS